MIKQLYTSTNHDFLWYCVNLWSHFKIMFTFQIDQQHTEVSATQIQSQEFTSFYNKQEYIRQELYCSILTFSKLPFPLGKSWTYVIQHLISASACVFLLNPFSIWKRKRCIISSTSLSLNIKFWHCSLICLKKRENK